MSKLPSNAPQTLPQRLRHHVTVLAGDIGERNVWRYEALKASADYVETTLRNLGYSISDQTYEAAGKTVRNIQAERLGSTQPDEIIVVGAHYDSVTGCPGANDNGSGVAAVLELARLLKDHKPTRTIRFVAFVNEEPPFFQTAEMGSRVYARRCRERGEKIVAMLTPETIGYYSDVRGSQKYPAPFAAMYPDTGNFIGFVGNVASAPLVQSCVESFRKHSNILVESAAVPDVVSHAGWSDHWSFWQEGYPGLMITDTAPFRYPHYHTPQDTPDKIDYDRTAGVVTGLQGVIRDLDAKP